MILITILIVNCIYMENKEDSQDWEQENEGYGGNKGDDGNEDDEGNEGEYDVNILKPTRRRRGRGPIVLSDLVRLRNQGTWLQVEFDCMGVSLGWDDPHFMNYLGNLARTHVLLNYKD